MASKNQNKAPSSPSQSIDKRRRIDKPKMPLNTGTKARHAFSVVNGGQEQPPTCGPPSNSGSDCGVIEFTKESAEALLNEKMRIKNNLNYKV